MKWFGYIWDDVRSGLYLWFLFEAGTSWGWWITIHTIAIIAGSLAYFLLMKGGAE